MLNEAVNRVMQREIVCLVIRTWLRLGNPYIHDLELVNDLAYWLVPNIHIPNFYTGDMAPKLMKVFARSAAGAYSEYKEWMKVE